MLLRSASAQEDYTDRRTLARDIVKLAIVVMANQTPISQADAQAVLPVLKDIRAQMPLSEESAATLDANLTQSYSPTLKAAVGVVRLPDMSQDLNPEKLSRLHQMMERFRANNPTQEGPVKKMFDRLITFFENTAAGQ